MKYFYPTPFSLLCNKQRQDNILQYNSFFFFLHGVNYLEYLQFLCFAITNRTRGPWGLNEAVKYLFPPAAQHATDTGARQQ